MLTLRRSYAFDGVGGTWHWYIREGKNIPFGEIHEHAEQIRVRDGTDAELDFRAAIVEKISAAHKGELEQPDDGRAFLTRKPGIMELKWRLAASSWRLYYSEPIALSPERVMLGLRFNEKTSVEQQDQDIDESMNRFTWWSRDQAS